VQSSAPDVSTGSASGVTATGATVGGTVNPNGFYTYYHVEYGLDSGLGTSTPPVSAGSGSSQVSVSVPLSGLSPSTTYYFSVVASNDNGNVKGAEGTFTTAAAVPPTATTGSATGVATTSATLSGTVNPNSDDTTYYFQYGKTSSFGSVTATVDAGAGAIASQVSQLVSGLVPGTTYVFRLVATNAYGTSRGLTGYFTTGTAVSAVTGQATNVVTNAATLNGTVNPQGANTTYYFGYGTSTALGRQTKSQTVAASNGAVSVSTDITGLEPGTTYYFRLVATNVIGTAQGAVDTLKTTPALIPTATTGSAGSVSMTSATLSGTVNPNSTDTTYSFQYGTTSSLGSSTGKVDAGAGTADVQASASVTGLKAGTTYIFRVIATNAYGTAKGAEQTFTTAAAPGKPTAIAGGSANVLTTSATVTGSVDPNGSATKYYFEYGTTESLGSRTSELDAGAGATSVQVSTNLTGLKAGTAYFFRLVATNAYGTAEGAEQTFTTITAPTAPGKPAATTGGASSVLTTSAMLTGSVDPNGAETTYHFEYGTSAASGLTTPVTDAGAGSTATQVSAEVKGLKPNTSYLFTLVATNSHGTSEGIAQVMTTAETSCAADEAAVASAEKTVKEQEQTVAAAELSLQQTNATIAASSTTSEATIAQYEAAVQQDQATVASAEKALAETTLLAPVSGTVTAVNATVGETVGGTGSTVTTGAENASSSGSTGQSAGASSSGSSAGSSDFIAIQTVRQLEVVSGFPEADATQLAVGQPATITFPALPETEVAARVIAVSPTSTVVNNVVTYDATIRLIAPPLDVKQGMTANVSVVVNTRSHVLELPSSAITTTGTISTVELLQNGKTSVTRIQTGLVGDSSTEIVSGVSAGDVVVVPTVSVSVATTTTSGFGGAGGGGFFGGGGGGLGGGGGFTRGG